MTVPAGYDSLTEGAGLYAETGLSLLLVTGEDRKGWLQGQVTQDLRDFALGHSLDACLVAATGQIRAVLRLWSLPGRIAVLTEAPEALLERAAKFVVLEDVRVELTQSRVVSVQGPRATGTLASLADLPHQDGGEVSLGGGVGLALRSRRTWAGGWDLCLDDGAAPAVLARGLEPVSAEAWNLATLEAGFPLIGVDTDAKTLPPELGHRFEAQHVSHSKGCYMGQEVLHRIHSRGHTNRTWVGLELAGSVVPGDTVSVRGRSDVGRVTRCVWSAAHGWIGAAMVRNEAAESGTPVTVGSVVGEVCSLPLASDD